jgi:hypothetical protein
MDGRLLIETSHVRDWLLTMIRMSPSIDTA